MNKAARAGGPGPQSHMQETRAGGLLSSPAQRQPGQLNESVSQNKRAGVAGDIA